MQYMVVGADGKEYGPATVDTLKQWAAENRLLPTSQLRDPNTGQLLLASSVPDLFPASASSPVATMAPPPSAGQWSQPPTPMAAYNRPMPQAAYRGSGPTSDIWGAIIRSVLAIVFFFFLHGIGLIFAAYGLYYAIRAQSNGHKYGIVAIVISGLTLAAVALGWVLRLS